MKRFSIQLIFLSLFIFTSSFGLIEYNSLRTKTVTIQLDSAQKVRTIQSIHSNYTTQLAEEQKSKKKEDNTSIILENLAKYLIIGIKTVFTTLIKIALSF